MLKMEVSPSNQALIDNELEIVWWDLGLLVATALILFEATFITLPCAMGKPGSNLRETGQSHLLPLATGFGCRIAGLPSDPELIASPYQPHTSSTSAHE